MNDEERTAVLLTRIASETHAPASALAAIDRAAASAPVSRGFALARLTLPRALPAISTTGIALAVLVVSLLLPAGVNAADILGRRSRPR